MRFDRYENNEMLFTKKTPGQLPNYRAALINIFQKEVNNRNSFAVVI